MAKEKGIYKVNVFTLKGYGSSVVGPRQKKKMVMYGLRFPLKNVMPFMCTILTIYISTTQMNDFKACDDGLLVIVYS